MPKTFETLSLQDAKRMLAAGEAKADQIGIPYNIAVVDAGGYLLAFSRQDGALIGSIDLAIQKAFTARIFDISTGVLAELAQPGKPFYGIHGSNDGKIVIFGGGLPVRRKGIVIGARNQCGHGRTGYRSGRGRNWGDRTVHPIGICRSLKAKQFTFKNYQIRVMDRRSFSQVFRSIIHLGLRAHFCIR